MIFYDKNLEHWRHTIESLTLVGRAGIVLNPDKFQFAQSTADFAGFCFSQSLVEPLPKYLHAIEGFPTSDNTTDIRSWGDMIECASELVKAILAR